MDVLRWTGIGLALTVSAAAVAAEQQPIRVAVDLVHFSVVVTDRHGAPISGLTADDFRVVERGKPQQISFFAAGDPALAPPLHLAFLLDASGSMEADMRDVHTAAIRFLSETDEAADVTLVDFDTEVRVARFGTADYPRLIERIRMRRPKGYTAFYDAIGMYLRGAANQPGQKVMVAYTDGADTRSSMRPGEVAEMLKGSDVTMYALGYLQRQSSSAQRMAQLELQRFASTTGGQAFFPSSLKDLDGVYEKIRAEIAARYTLGYVSADALADGSWRAVEITLNRPDLRGAKIRTRPGYFAPYAPAAVSSR